MKLRLDEDGIERGYMARDAEAHEEIRRRLMTELGKLANTPASPELVGLVIYGVLAGARLEGLLVPRPS